MVNAPRGRLGLEDKGEPVCDFHTKTKVITGIIVELENNVRGWSDTRHTQVNDLADKLMLSVWGYTSMMRQYQ
jgi:hypothetical protein